MYPKFEPMSKKPYVDYNSSTTFMTKKLLVTKKMIIFSLHFYFFLFKENHLNQMDF